MKKIKLNYHFFFLAMFLFQFPFASYLLDAILAKLNEKKKLGEEYSFLMKRSLT